MGFGKALGAGIGVLLGFNVLMTVLAQLLYGVQIGDPMTPLVTFFTNLANPSTMLTYILYMLGGYYSAGAIIFALTTIGTLITTSITTLLISVLIFTGLIFVIALVLNIGAACIVGYLGHSPMASFGAWFLANTIVAIIPFIGVVLVALASPITMMIVILGYVPALVAAIIVNGLAYGVIAMGMGYQYEE